jgi:hypothetical protein
MDEQKQQQPQSNLPPVPPEKPTLREDIPVVPTPAPEAEPSTGAPVPPSAFDVGFSTPPPVVATKPKKKKKIFVILLAILLALVAGIAAAYQFWYQNPEKVVSDSIVHALQVKTTTYTGTVDLESDTAKVKVAIKGAYVTGAQNLDADITLSIGSISYTLAGIVLIDSNSDLYIKVANLGAIVAPLRATFPESAQASFDSLVSKIDNKWVKVSAEELATYNTNLAHSQACINNVVQQAENHASFLQEVEDIYKNNKFVTISEQLGEKDGSFGYVLTTDKDTMKSFAIALKNTEAYKTVHDCDANFTIDEDNLFGQAQEGATTRVELWVSKFRHQITQFSSVATQSQSSSTTSLVLKPVFDTDITVTAPEGATTLKQLQVEIEALQKAAMQEARTTQTGL